jgi:hypothetical protein
MSRPKGWLASVAVALTMLIALAIAPRASAETTITVAPVTPQFNNCWPFGLGGGGMSWGPHMAFIYRSIPAFELKPGDRIAFDTHGVNTAGGVNPVSIQLEIALARTTVNGGTQNAQTFETVVTNGQTAAAPSGDTIAGNFDLAYSAEIPFSFPGGGLIIRFSNPAPGYAADSFCNGNLVGAGAGDPSGFFVQRAFTDADGNFPWTGASNSDIGAVQLTILDPLPPDTEPPETTITNAPSKTVKSHNKTAHVLFEFASSEQGSTFACSLDGGPFEPCGSPHVAKVKAKRKAKKHDIAVRATDAAGNTDPTPADDEFKTKRKKKQKKR